MAGIAWGNSDAFLDEHPQAYKPIDVVMHDARNLVEVVHELRQKKFRPAPCGDEHNAPR